MLPDRFAHQVPVEFIERTTDKSSVLQLIDYALGAKKAPSYPEILKCSEVIVECVAGGELVTIKRSLRGETSKSWIYAGTLDEAFQGRIDGMEVSARHISSGPSVSSELLQRLSLSNIDVKTAPTRESSDTHSYSIRDLLLLLYIDQDRMGSKRAGFFEDNPHKAIKWNAGVEIVHGLFDKAAAALSESLNAVLNEEQRVRQFLLNAQAFLTQSRIPQAEELEQQIEELSGEEDLLKRRLMEARKAAQVQLGESYELVRRRDALEDASAKHASSTQELRRTLNQLGRLRVQYERERAQLDFLSESEMLVGRLPVVRCPGCLQPFETGPSADCCHVCQRPLPPQQGEITVEARLRATRRKISDLEEYIGEIEAEAQENDRKRALLADQLSEVGASLTKLRQVALFPDERGAVDASEALSLLAGRIRKAREHLVLRQRARGEGSTLLALQERVRNIRDELARVTALSPSPDAVVTSLSQRFSRTLRDIRFPEVRDARIDRENFHPIVRGQEYGQLSSKGAIALAMTAWHLAVLEYGFDETSRFPGLLLLDSPLSHVGHDSKDEEFKDQQIVEAFYELLAKLHASHASEMQIVLVDNRPPTSAADLIAVAFTGDPNQGLYGLIDDERPPQD